MDQLETKKTLSGNQNIKKQKVGLEEGDKVLIVMETNLHHQPSSSSLLVTKPEEEEDKILESDEEVEMHRIPPEMLEKILKNLDVKSLLASCCVSKKWKAFSRKLLKLKDVEIKFRAMYDGKFVAKGNQSSLGNFIYFFKDSKDSPLYTRFYFETFEPSDFEYPYWIRFISVLGPSIKSLRLVICAFENFDDELPGFLVKLENLLFHQLPNLQELGLQLPKFVETRPFPNIQLFSKEKMCQLVHLKVIYLDSSTFFDYPTIATDLLLAAVNLETIQPFDDGDFHQDIGAFQFLQFLGKLHCLKRAEIRLNSQLMFNNHYNPSAQLNFKLQTLILKFEPGFTPEDLRSLASIFLSNLFESIKDTLKELQVDPIEFLPRLELPKFTKLPKFTTVNLVAPEQDDVLTP